MRGRSPASMANAGLTDVRGAHRGRYRRARPCDPDHDRRYRDRENEGAGRNQLGQRDRAPALATLPRIGEPDVLQPG